MYKQKNIISIIYCCYYSSKNTTLANQLWPRESPRSRAFFRSRGIEHGGVAIRTAGGDQRDVVLVKSAVAAVQGDDFAGKRPHPEICWTFVSRLFLG